MSNGNSIGSNNKLNFKTKNELVDYYRNMYKTIPDYFIEKIQKIITFLRTSLSEQLEQEYFFAFTGGKDCLAALIIIKLYYFLKQKIDYTVTDKLLLNFFANYSMLKLPKNLFKVAYFMNNEDFEEEEDYIINFVKEEDLDIFYVYSDFVKGLKYLINKYNMSYIVMGTRSTDLKNNNGDIDIYQFLHKSTYPYPEFKRVYPVFHFDLEDVWRIILLSKVKYLDLYNRGYSSIGKVKNSKVNENLMFKNESLPAWCLNKEYSNTERSYR